MKLALLALLALPAWALSNAVTIHSQAEEVPSTQVHRIPRWFARGEITGYPRPFVGGVAAAAWQADVKNRWDDGSVRFAIVSFPAGIGAGASIVVDFRNSPDACHAGSQAACEAAALDRDGILNFGSWTWHPVMGFAADPAGSTTANWIAARTMIENSHFTYWLRGPVITEVIAEDASPARQYDFGWTSSGCTQPYADCAWVDDPVHRSLHPIFVLSLPAGMSSVRVQFIAANYWTGAKQDQRYSLTLATSAGAVFGKADVKAGGGTWWRKEYFDGAAPVPTRIDFNLEYLRYSKMVMPFKPGVTITPTGQTSIAASLAFHEAGMSSDFPFWCPSLASNQCGSRFRYYGSTGGRPDRGFYPLWEAQWLYSMNTDLFGLVVQNAEYVGSQQIHYRESVAGLTYRAGVDSFGLPVSLNARDNLWHNGAINWTGPPAAVGPFQAGYGYWAPDSAHMHTHAQLAYLATGDWWFMQEQAFLGHYIFGWVQKEGRSQYTRKGSWGFLKFGEANHRSAAWKTWNLWRATLIIPDGDPQKLYLADKLEDAIAIFEGAWNIVDGDHYEPCATDPFVPLSETSRWCWGRMEAGWGQPNSLNQSEVRGNAGWLEGLNSAVVWRAASPWMENFLSMAMFDMCRTEGRACAIARYHAEKQSLLASSGSGKYPKIWMWYRNPVSKKVSTTLTQGLTNSSSDRVIHVEDASVFPEPPTAIDIGSERIWVVSRDLANNTLTAGSGQYGGRQYNDSGGIYNHSAGATVYANQQFATLAEMWETSTSAEGTGDRSHVLIAHNSLFGDNYAGHQCAAGLWSEDFAKSKRAGEVWAANCHDNELQGAGGTYSKEADPRWFFFPDRGIHQIRIGASGGTASFEYVAPGGGPCRVYVGPAPPPSSDDSADPLDTPTGRQHSYTVSGLSAGENHYRVSCGQVRETGTFIVP